MKLKFVILICTLLAPTLAQALELFDVQGRMERTPTGVTYHYTVTNNSHLDPPVGYPAQKIFSFEIGKSATYLLGATSHIDNPAMLPDGPNIPVFTAPPGWKASFGGWRENPGYTVVWEADEDANGQFLETSVIAPGQTLSGFSVSTNVANPEFLNKCNARAYGEYDTSVAHPGHGMTLNCRVTVAAIVPDNIPPRISVTLTPRIVAKLVPGRVYIKTPRFRVTAAIVVSDNLDPTPLVKLESMTLDGAPYVPPVPYSLNGAKDPADVATFGTDDRAFALPVTARASVYTVTYSATDLNGNKTLATGTVTVR